MGGKQHHNGIHQTKDRAAVCTIESTSMASMFVYLEEPVVG